MRVSVVGLGPGPREWITPAALSRLRAPDASVFARTRFFPGLDELLAGIGWTSFDELYETASTLDEVHATIANRLLEAGDDVVLAVPGDGVLGEAVLARLISAGAEVSVVPGVPLSIGALTGAHLSAASGAQVVEATALGGNGIDLLIELNPRWPAVVTGVFSPRVASDLKLALLRIYPPEHTVSLVRHPGLADERVQRVTLAELDRGVVELDHLTHVVLPPVLSYLPTGSSHTLRAIVARLRAPGIGCPWDLEQTHRSLIPYAIEEAYEVVDAIEQDDTAGLADELGDLLLQVALHAEIADQSDEFEWNDVVRGLSEKLVRRHPHVFGDALSSAVMSGSSAALSEVRGAADVVRNWDQLKAAERSHEPPRTSALDGVPNSLPQLKRAAELSRKAVKAGFEWPSRQGTLDKVREELDELLSAASLAERREELGDLLWIIAKLARDDGIDPEEALRAANRKFAMRFSEMEQIGREQGWESLASRSFEELEAAWKEAKRRTAQPA